jgi:transposase-like protein
MLGKLSQAEKANDVIKLGHRAAEKQRYRCQNPECKKQAMFETSCFKFRKLELISTP